MKKTAALILTSFLGVAFVASVAFANYGEDNSLSGKVKDKNTRVNLKRAKVKLYSESGRKLDSDKTNSKGKYKFEDLEEDTYKVKATLAGYRNPKKVNKMSVSKTVKVDGDDTKNLYLQKI